MYKILVADDAEYYADEMERILTVAGHKVLKAYDGDQALKLFQENRDVDLIITDLNMSPGMNGIELLYSVRKINPLIPVILESGQPTREAMEAGFTEVYDTFPLMRKLLEIVATHLKK